MPVKDFIIYVLVSFDGDKGYIRPSLKQELAQRGIDF